MADKVSKYLTFILSDEEYAVPIEFIREILGIMPMTKAPNLPEYLKGLINLRGKIIPVTDLRLKLGLKERDYDSRTSTIIAETQTEEGVKVRGFIVDQVQEVIELDSNAIDETPKFGSEFNREFFLGIGKMEENVVLLLDCNKILSIN